MTEKRDAKTRMASEEAWEHALVLESILDDAHIRHEVCGSLRRGRRNGISSIDIAVAPPLSDALAEILRYATKMRWPVKILGKVTPLIKQISFEIAEISYNLYSARDEHWGAMVLFLTGNKLFNMLIRGEAKKQGYRLNERGLWLRDDLIAAKTEELIFYALSLVYVPPQNRDLNYGQTSLRPIRRISKWG